MRWTGGETSGETISLCISSWQVSVIIIQGWKLLVAHLSFQSRHIKIAK